MARDKAGDKAGDKENDEARNAEAFAAVGRAVFDAHRQFITSCVEQLEVHTYMLSQAEVASASGLHGYVDSLTQLIEERQSALAALQRQLHTFRDTVREPA